MDTKFGQRSLLPEFNALHGSKVTQGSFWVNQRSNCLEMPSEHQIWLEEPLIRANYIAGSKVVAGSSGVKQRSDCSGMPYGHQIWSQESLIRMMHIARVKGQAGVIRGQP